MNGLLAGFVSFGFTNIDMRHLGIIIVLLGLTSTAFAQGPFLQEKVEAAWSNTVVPGTRIVKFVDESHGDITSWKWDFGDGTFSTERNPVHVYAVDGANNGVTLYVSGPGGESRLSRILDAGAFGNAGTSRSLFWRADSLQVDEIVSQEAVQYSKVGHHGPAVENAWSAFRIYFNDSGAIDVYSKGNSGPELDRYHWYPTEEQQASESAGVDEYLVGKTVGLGGIALWDGKQEVKLVATKGRTARVGKTSDGSYAEIVAYGVMCRNKSYDISIRVDVFDGDRVAKVTAKELNGKKVRFLTGVNYHPEESVVQGRGYAAVWGVHPADVAQDPAPIGAAILYDARTFPSVTRTEDMVRLVSRPSVSVSTRIAAASANEPGLNTEELFLSFINSL